MTTSSNAVFASVQDAIAFVNDHPGFSADWISSGPAAPGVNTPIFATQAEAQTYVENIPASAASYQVGSAMITLQRQTYPVVGLNLELLADDLTTLRQAMVVNPGFDGARPEVTLPVRQALGAALTDVTSALATAEAAMAPTPGVGGAVAGQSGTANALAFYAFLLMAEQAPTLVDLNSFLTRMADNIVLGGTTASDTTNLQGAIG